MPEKLPGWRTNGTRISAVAMKPLSRKKGAPVPALTLYEIKQNIEAKTTKKQWREQISLGYHDFQDLFDEKLAPDLPSHQPYDHFIPRSEGKKPPFGPLYCMSRDELIALKDTIEENLSKAFIRASASPAGAAVLFIKKGD